MQKWYAVLYAVLALQDGCFQWLAFTEMGVSENSVPLNPMVNDHYPY